MPAVAIFSVVLVALLVAALAIYLLWVVFILRDVNGALAQVGDTFDSLVAPSRPVNEAVHIVNGELERVADAVGAEPPPISGPVRSA